jgi:hypothetical protein
MYGEEGPQGPQLPPNPSKRQQASDPPNKPTATFNKRDIETYFETAANKSECSSDWNCLSSVLKWN